MAETSLLVNQPDSGQKPSQSLRYGMLVLGMFTYGTFYTGRQNFGVAAALLREDLHLSAFQIGSISGSLMITYALGGLMSGYLADRFGTRRLVCTGAFLSLLLNWTTSFAGNYQVVLLPWALNGFAQALGWAPCSRMVTNWWPAAQRGFAFGMLLLAAGSAALATYALSLASMDFGGWRYVFRLPVLLVVPSIILFSVFAKSPPSVGDSETGKGLPSLTNWWHHFRPLAGNKRFVLFCGSIGCENAARYGLLVWVPIHMLGRDWRVSDTGKWLILLLPLGMAIGAACTGFLSDRVFHRNRVQLIVSQMLFGVLMTGALYAIPKSNVVLFSLLLLFAGFTVYGPQAAYWAVGADLGGSGRRGIAIGTMDACAYIFAALGEACIGWLVDRTGTTAAIFPAIACACLLAACLATPLLTQQPDTIRTAPN